ncbi:MAG: hypothetical protein C5B59_10055 [Bacteroidetes bacterium]|nr:MAG: hypothetical protein C5B59_10055 [Bacteroidota bacterium]
MLTRQIALVSQSEKISLKETALISAALQKQIVRDFTPIWEIDASIDPFDTLDDVPLGYWPIIIKDDIGQAGAGGFHLDKNGQPYSLVATSDETSLACSHEMIEMLVDPFGSRQVASDSIMEGQGRVSYLVEACDPCEGIDYAYTVNGVVVSDFYTPNYFDPVVSGGVRYSYNGSIKQPKQLLPGGYLSWLVAETGDTWQAKYFTQNIEYVNLGKLQMQTKSWREIIDSLTLKPAIDRMKNPLKVRKGQSSKKMLVSEMNISAATGRAKSLTAEINALADTVPLTFSVLFTGGKGKITFSADDLPGSPRVISYDNPSQKNPQVFTVNQSADWHLTSKSGAAPDKGKISLRIKKGDTEIYSEDYAGKNNPIVGSIAYNAGA